MSPALEAVVPAESAAKLNKSACRQFRMPESEFRLYLSAKLIFVNNPG
jgi:hypothetical protein